MDKPKVTPMPTPGPWRLAKCGNGFYIGEIRGPKDTDYEQDVIADWVWEGNARLIAAAPDMYEALLDLLASDDETSWQSAQLKAHAALAKAEGRTDA